MMKYLSFNDLKIVNGNELKLEFFLFGLYFAYCFLPPQSNPNFTIIFFLSFRFRMPQQYIDCYYHTSVWD